MDVVIVYHSETGQTRLVAEQVAKRTGAILIPVQDQTHYNVISRYLIGARLAQKGEKAIIKPPQIDISLFRGVVIGCPVWAWHPTPAFNAIIQGLQGCQGKPGIIFATSAGMPGETLNMMKRALEGRGVRVLNMFHFGRKEVQNQKKIGKFVSAVTAMRGASSG
jgi:menaquinone-dependent protoporphyrinogen IX oxidase